MNTAKRKPSGETRTQFLIRQHAAEENVRLANPDTSLSKALTLKGCRVLIVDDEADVRELLTVMLEQYGAKVAAVASTADALAAFEEFKPDVIVSDISMPGEDGYALIRKIRTLELAQSAHIPAVALTAYNRFEDRQRALLAGYHMHLPKTVAPAELAAILVNLMDRMKKA